MLKLTTLKDRRVRGDLIQWYKIVKGFDKVSWINEPRLGHPRMGVRSQYILENVNNCLQRKRFFTNRVTEVWNKLPDSVVEAPTVNSFKERLDVHLRSCHSSSVI